VPTDEILDLVRTGFSPGLRRMMATAGAAGPFDLAQEMLEELAGIRVTDKDVERITEAVGQDMADRREEEVQAAMQGRGPEGEEAPAILYLAVDGTGVPTLRRETEGRRGKAADGVARSREVKLGAVFTQTTTDEEGHPVRDEDSTTYVGKIESVETFGPRLYTEACRRGLAQAGKVVVLGDGAPWIWNLADEHFPAAVQIVDFYHAHEHLGDLAKVLHPRDDSARRSWLEPFAKALWEGRLPDLLAQLRLLQGRTQHEQEVTQTLDYFQHNASRMRYGHFRAQGFFIGSGVVEAGCKTVIGQRLKQSGMHWSVRGANAIIALRTCIKSRRFADYWDARCAA
jgi:hypothetical protein